MEYPPLFTIGAQFNVEVWSSSADAEVTYDIDDDIIKIEIDMRDGGTAKVFVDVAEGTVTCMLLSFRQKIALTIIRSSDGKTLLSLPVIEIASPPGSSTLLMHADQRVRKTEPPPQPKIQWVRFFKNKV